MKTKGWLIYFKGEKKDRSDAGICCWARFNGAMIFEHKNDAIQALARELDVWIGKEHKKKYTIRRCEIHITK